MSARAGVNRWYLTIGLIGCGAYLVLPRSTAAQALFVALAVSAPLVAAVSLRRYESPVITAWRLLTVGLAIAAVGEVVDFIKWPNFRRATCGCVS